MSTTRYALNAPAVVHEWLDGEVIVIHLTSGCYYNLQGSADYLWACILAGWTAAEITGSLDLVSTLPPDELDTTISNFIADLLAEDLITPRANDSREAAPDLPDLAAFTVPEIEKFTDMQELMLVDPIHEVTEAGWPQVASPSA
jgi:hypothetical protein